MKKYLFVFIFINDVHLFDKHLFNFLFAFIFNGTRSDTVMLKIIPLVTAVWPEPDVLTTSQKSLFSWDIKSEFQAKIDVSP